MFLRKVSYKVFAISDLHLSFGVPQKSMDVFGIKWKGHADKIKKQWNEKVSKNDLVVIAGDISWAKKLEDALIDLNWIDKLSGTKLIIKGNHDFWWPSNKKMLEILPKSINFINKNSFNWNDVSICGARLWDSEEYCFDEYIEFRENALEQKEKVNDFELNKKIFNKEIEKLKISLSQLDLNAKVKIAVVHYPPIDVKLNDSIVSLLLESYKIDFCIFGHLHNVRTDREIFGKKGGIRYVFTSCDYLNFSPTLIL